MRSHIGWRGNETFLIRMWKSFPIVKIVRFPVIRNEPKWTISASSELGLLQMVSKPDTWQCTIENVEPSNRVDCEIPHQLKRERIIPYKDV